LALAALAWAVLASPARAQSLPPTAARGIEFLSRFDFHVGMDHLFSDDRRFVWDAQFGADMDIVDYGRGRAIFAATYQTILGSEFRAFDPNQGNYMLEGAISARSADLEVAGVFHHVSRHLSDRPKPHPVDWNMIGGRISAAATRGRTDLRGRFDIRGVVQKSFVDYRWEVAGDGAARIGLVPRVAAVAAGSVRVLGVDGSRTRGTQYGLRGEGGIRLEGRAAALDLLVAAERRVDPYQLEFGTATWLTAGFRLASR
jgi:hypothetical protein